MRSRVAFYVTLIALLVLSLLFFYNCSRLAEEENVDRLEWVDSICNVVSGLTRNDSQQVRAEAVSVISAGPGIEKALFSADTLHTVTGMPRLLLPFSRPRASSAKGTFFRTAAPV